MKKLLTFAFLVIMASTASYAVPAWRRTMKKQLADGSIVTLYIIGDEYGHRLMTADGIRVMENADGSLRRFNPATDTDVAAATDPAINRTSRKNAPRRAGNKMSPYQIGSFPTKGDVRGLVILADFTDKKMTFGQDYHDRMMNSEGFSEDGCIGSARDYFISQSQGQFRPTFDVVGPVTLPRTSDYYGKNSIYTGADENSDKMISDACQVAHDELGVDFSQYDYDGDGYVDMVYVIFAGYGENAGGGANTVWPKKWNLTQAGNNLRLDGKIIDVFACSAELFGNSGQQSSSIGTFCHEFGHVLGLADHYSTTDSRSYHLGSYDLMDYGAYNNDSRIPPSYNAFERMTLGWLTPDELTTAKDGLTLGDIQETNKAYRISTRGNADEFYLLESRCRKGWDSYIPGDGLMITHVDFNMALWNQNSVNTDDDHMRFHMVCADNDMAYDVVAGYATEATDLYPQPGNNGFTDNSKPAAKPFTGEKLDRGVYDISAEDGNVTFNFMANHLKTPLNPRVTDIRRDGFTAQWDATDSRAESYTMIVSRLRPESENVIAMKEGFDLMTAGSAGSPDSKDISGELDNYMTVKGWTGTELYQAGGTLKMGGTKTTGTMKSPEMNFSKHLRDFCVVVKVASATGQQPVFSVSANGLTAKHRITSTPRTYIYKFAGAGLTATTIDIAVQKEQAFVDSIIIMRGADAEQLYPDAKAITITGTIESTEDKDVEEVYYHAEQTIYENINDTHADVNGLEENARYAFMIKAKGQLADSEYTKETTVLTGTSLGIDTIDATEKASKATDIYTIDGRKISRIAAPGIYIKNNKKIIVGRH